jgi:hypothetical protein
MLKNQARGSERLIRETALRQRRRGVATIFLIETATKKPCWQRRKARLE